MTMADVSEKILDEAFGGADFLSAVPSTKEKLLVDMVNCIHVAGEQIEVQIEHESRFFSRWLSTVTGADDKRMHRIQKNQNVALCNVVSVINALSASLTRSNGAITRAGQRLTEIEHGLTRTVNVLVDVRTALRALEENLGAHADQVDERLARIDLRAAANEELDWVLSRWEVGKFSAVPVAARCFLALHELRAGHFGEFVRRNAASPEIKRFFERCIFKITSQMNSDLGLTDDERVSMRGAWLANPARHRSAGSREFVEGTAFLGSYSSAVDAPMVLVCSREFGGGEPWPTRAPMVCNAERIASALAREMFDGCAPMVGI